ncbi:MAG: HAD-IA family hydrolase [Patescibacteria group bacterium]
MIKAIFFDFDGVLTTDSHGSVTTASYIEEKTGVKKEKFIECYRKYKKDFSIDATKRYEDIWGDICECIGKQCDIEVLFEAFRKTPKNQKMFDLARKLRENYQTGVITDNTKERFEVLKQVFELDKYFDALILSADVGAGKEDKSIFQFAIDSLDVKASECIFIDNYKENFIAAADLGIKTYYHDETANDIEAMERQLTNWGVKI